MDIQDLENIKDIQTVKRNFSHTQPSDTNVVISPAYLQNLQNSSQRTFKQQTLPTYSLGFSLIELMITISIVAIIAGVAIPNYKEYTKNRHISEALTSLINLSTQMEKRYVDVRNYGGEDCGITAPTNVSGYTFSCTKGSKTYTWVATSSDNKYKYSIDEKGNKLTTKFNGDASTATCWVVSSGGSCY